MTKRIATLALCCAALAACGGGGGDGVNPAAAKTFTYGAAQSATPPLSAGDAIASLSAFQTSADEESAALAQGALMETAFEALGDDFGIGGFAATESPSALVREARSRTFAAALGQAATQFSGECTVSQAVADGFTRVTFDRCQVSETSTDGTSMNVTVNGWVQGKPGAVAWDVEYRLAMTSPEATIVLGYVDEGDVALSASALTAHQDASVNATFSGGGQSGAVGFAQSVDLDVALAESCATHITDGTLEVKRVWTRRPSGASAEELADRGVKYDWTGCGTATVQFSL